MSKLKKQCLVVIGLLAACGGDADSGSLDPEQFKGKLFKDLSVSEQTDLCVSIKAELAPGGRRRTARLAQNHLVVSRSGAGTVAELAAIGRPSSDCTVRNHTCGSVGPAGSTRFGLPTPGFIFT